MNIVNWPWQANLTHLRAHSKEGRGKICPGRLVKIWWTLTESCRAQSDLSYHMTMHGKCTCVGGSDIVCMPTHVGVAVVVVCNDGRLLCEGSRYSYFCWYKGTQNCVPSRILQLGSLRKARIFLCLFLQVWPCIVLFCIFRQWKVTLLQDFCHFVFDT